jgi:hypothetical protein
MLKDKKNIVVLLLILLAASVYGGTRDPDTSDEKYTEFGKKFIYIYKICGTYENNENFCASAVAIDKNHLLTAAHVVTGSRICKIIEDENIYIVNKIVCHKDFKKENFGFYDIAILRVEENLKIDGFPELYTDSDELNKQCTISGYGITGTFETGIITSDGKRRAGSNTIDKIENDLLICSPSKENKTKLEFLIGSGDSGGGLFIGNKLAGINSCVMTMDKKTNSDYGDESGHTRISNHYEWIIGQLHE